jgi:hypothetical protein
MERIREGNSRADSRLSSTFNIDSTAIPNQPSAQNCTMSSQQPQTEQPTQQEMSESTQQVEHDGTNGEQQSVSRESWLVSAGTYRSMLRTTIKTSPFTRMEWTASSTKSRTKRTGTLRAVAGELRMAAASEAETIAIWWSSYTAVDRRSRQTASLHRSPTSGSCLNWCTHTLGNTG